MGIATCAICQREFERRSNALYCSPECKRAARREQSHTEAGRERGRVKKQRQRERDPERQREIVRRSRIRHRDERNIATKQWHETHPGYRKEQSQKWRKSHPKEKCADSRRYYQAHKQEKAEWLATYRREHPEVLKASNSRRRARIKNADGSWSAEQFREVCKLSEWCCVYCGMHTHKLTPDHAIPLSRGGSNDISNIVPACLSCNASKGDKTAEEYINWLEQLRL